MLAKQYTDICLTRLATMFGGATAQAATGAWMSESKGLIKEDITIVYAFTDEAGLNDHRAEVIQLATDIASGMTQEAVSVEIDGSLQFIAAQRQAA